MDRCFELKKNDAYTSIPTFCFNSPQPSFFVIVFFDIRWFCPSFQTSFFWKPNIDMKENHEWKTKEIVCHSVGAPQVAPDCHWPKPAAGSKCVPNRDNTVTWFIKVSDSDSRDVSDIIFSGVWLFHHQPLSFHDMFDPLSLPINSGGLRPRYGHLGNWMTNQRIQWISATRFFHTWHRHLVSSGPGFRWPPISAAHLHSSASCDGSCMGGDDVRVRHQDFQVVFVAKNNVEPS